MTIAIYGSVLAGFLTSFFESWLYAIGGIMAFTFFCCLVLLMRMLEFQKFYGGEFNVRDRR